MMRHGLPRRYTSLLAENHAVRVRVELLDLEGHTLHAITNRLLDGQVTVNATSEVTRSCSMTFLDPDHQLNVDANSPADGALYADRMVRVWHEVRAHDEAGWIAVPIFTGPLVKFSRDGVRVEVEAQGKELLAMGSAWKTKTWKKGAAKVEVIEECMRELAGERNFSLAKVPSKLPEDRSIVAQMTPWEFCQRLADSMDRQLYYDGAGRLRLRRPPGRSLFTFKAGDGGTVVTLPKPTFDITEVRNAIRVVGKKPKGAKKKVRARKVAAPSHPLSPRRLGRHDVPRRLGEWVEDDSIGSKKEAKRVAASRLRRRLLEDVSVRFDAFVVPHLDEGDVVTVRTDGFTMRFRLREFAIPFSAASTMPVGYSKNVRIKRKSIR